MKQRILGEMIDTDLCYYISGPMTGYKNYNYNYFEIVHRTLITRGLNIESPHRNPRPENWETMDKHELWLYMMDLCYKQMEGCQGIIMLKGWPQSTGARKELFIMLEKDAPVYYYDDFELINMNRPDDD